MRRYIVAVEAMRDMLFIWARNVFDATDYARAMYPNKRVTGGLAGIQQRHYQDHTVSY